jgi:acetyl esterase/lipase
MRSLHVELLAVLTLIVGCVWSAAWGETPSGDKPVELLWPQGAPLAQGEDPEDQPSLTIHLPSPEKANGAAVVVCPGGGYRHLALDHEGRQVAEWLNANGIAAFVLKYRLAPKYRYPAPMLDAQRAVRFVRAGAKEWSVDPDRIGILGFSAGGHLAATVGTHFDKGNPDSEDAIERAGCRPDFMILIYANATLKPEYFRWGAIEAIFADKATPELLESLSNETQVTAETPPAFLIHTNEDRVVFAENSVLFYLALRRAGVPAEMHIYEKGGHGFGLAPGNPILSTWPGHCIAWMHGRGFLTQN